jgi:hypothetical protein
MPESLRSGHITTTVIVSRSSGRVKITGIRPPCSQTVLQDCGESGYDPPVELPGDQNARAMASWPEQPPFVHTIEQPDGSRVVRWSESREDGRCPYFQVWWDPKDPSSDRVLGVMLVLPDGLTPTKLQRFAWAKWLAVADTSRRAVRVTNMEELNDVVQMSDAIHAATHGVRPPRGVVGTKKGRRGHPDEHYQRIAHRYQELRMGGDLSPAKTIAIEESFNVNTVRTWISTARKRHFLPPGRPGRAG